MKPIQSVLHRKGGGSILLRRCGKRDFLAITFSTMKREIESLKSALRTGHLSTSEVRLPWTPEEKHRHQVNGDAEYENRCKICVKSGGIFVSTLSLARYPGRST